MDISHAVSLDDGDVDCGGAFLALLNVERNAVSLVEGAETLGVDAGVMDENVGAILLLDEAKSL